MSASNQLHRIRNDRQFSVLMRVMKTDEFCQTYWNKQMHHGWQRREKQLEARIFDRYRNATKSNEANVVVRKISPLWKQEENETKNCASHYFLHCICCGRSSHQSNKRFNSNKLVAEFITKTQNLFEMLGKSDREQLSWKSCLFPSCEERRSSSAMVLRKVVFWYLCHNIGW